MIIAALSAFLWGSVSELYAEEGSHYWINPAYENLLKDKEFPPLGKIPRTQMPVCYSFAEVKSLMQENFEKRVTGFSFQMKYSFYFTDVKQILNQSFTEITSSDDYLLFNMLRWGGSWSGRNGDVTVLYQAEYHTTYEQEQQVSQRVGEILAEIISAGMNDEQKQKAVHDWIVLNVEYDSAKQEYSAYAALFLGHTVCQGYSLLACKMLRDTGITGKILSSPAMNHAWNMVYLCGNWYHMDVTWDDPVPDVAGRVLYTYYNKSDTEMNALNHTWDTGSYPEAPLSYAEGVCGGADLFPDLVVQNQNISPLSVMLGDTVRVSCTVRNQGNGAAGASILKYYLYFGQNYYAPLLGTDNIASLSAGSAETENALLTIPADTPAGTWQIMFYIDEEKAVNESNENNNGSYAPITVLTPPEQFPDLTVLNQSVNSSAVTAGSSLPVSCTVKNQGDAPAAASRIKYYLSADTVYDANDSYMGYNDVSELNSGSTDLKNASLTIPAGTDSGTWYILFAADADNSINESLENNNIGYSQISVMPLIQYPDLSISSLSAAPTSVTGGENVYVSCTVKNRGDAPSGDARLRYYLSDNTLYDSSDTYLGYNDIAALNSGSTAVKNSSLQIPPDTYEGTWYILCYADAGNAVTESNEDNNTAYVRINISACDYAVSPAGDSFSASGGTGNISVTAPDNCGWSVTANVNWISIQSPCTSSVFGTDSCGGTGSGNIMYSVAQNTETTSRTGIISIGGKSFTVTQAASVICSYTISPVSTSFGANGGNGYFSISTSAGCGWQAYSDSAWLSIISPCTSSLFSGSSCGGTGSGTIEYSVSPNSGTAARTGHITAGGKVYTVSQEASCVSLSPAEMNFTSAGGSGSISISAASGCNWNVISKSDWITVDSPCSYNIFFYICGGTGSGTVGYSVSPNTGPAARTGYIIAGGKTFTVNQEAAADCSYTLSSENVQFGANGGTGSLDITASSADCSWKAVSDTDWLTITSPCTFFFISSCGNGSGSGSIRYSVSPNPGTSPRTGRITVGGKILTVTQEGSCAYIAPQNRQFSYSGGTGNITVTAPSECYWSVTSKSDWITINSPCSYSFIFYICGSTGSSNVLYSVAQNTGASSRTGTLIIGGQTFTITQEGIPCDYSLSPSGQSFDSAGGTGTVNLSTSSGDCSWNAESDSDWIKITSPCIYSLITICGSGSGSAAIEYSVSGNTGTNSRTGTITVGSEIFTVSQSGVSDKLIWQTSKADAIALAKSQGKKILLLAGSETCGYTLYMRDTVCEMTSPFIKALIQENYIPWFSSTDTDTEWYSYAYGLGTFYLPLICRIDPDDAGNYLDRTTNIQDNNDFYIRLQDGVSIKGDVNKHNGVELSDALIALQIAAGINPGITLNPDSDVNSDRRIGIEEAVYVLKVVSGISR